jgi:hypothetical protein
VRCTRCGNDNAEGNRFCGMCGAAMTPGTPAASPAAKQPSIAAMAGPKAERNPAQAGRPERAPGSSAPAKPLSSFDSQGAEPVISGPSFLGLNQPGHSQSGFQRSDSDRGRDLLRPSGSVDYLLEDDEEPKRGWGKVIFVLVALALAGGFGYLHWKQGGFNWIYGSGTKPAATQPDSGSASSGSDSGSAGTAVPSTPSPAPNTPGTASAASGTARSSTTPAANPENPPATAGATAATGSATTAATPAPSQTAPGQSASQAAPSPDNSGQNSSSASGAQPSSSAATPASGPDSGAQPSTDEQPATPPAAKPATPKPPPPKPVDTVTEAERYIYGRGARQDCDHGLRMLKSAADRSDAKAMISLGGLYSAGTCTPRDLPTAYRWFALALHKQPDNQALQDDLQKLWSQMTQAERQLAIRLSQ